MSEDCKKIDEMIAQVKDMRVEVLAIIKSKRDAYNKLPKSLQDGPQGETLIVDREYLEQAEDYLVCVRDWLITAR